MEQITLDLIPNGSMPVLHASQYDDGRQWKVNLKENGEDYTLSDETIVLDVRKGDGCAVTCAVAVESGKKYVILTSTEQMCAVAGQNLAELQITKGNMKIGTLNFILQVERDPLNGSISSSSEIHDLQHQVDECVDNALADLGASGLPYDNTESGLEATNVQQAIDEVNAKASGLPSDVYTKEETDALLAEKADKADVYDKDYMNGIFEQIDNAFTGVNNALATKANSADVYNKTYIDTALSAKANANTVYTKAETDAKVAGLIDDTARADDKTWSSNKIFQMFTVEDEASGAIARFNTDLTENLLSAVAEFSASQASGTPTPANPIPIVGVDKVNVSRTQNNIFTSPIERGNINAYGEDTDNLNPNRSRTAKQIAVSPSTEYTVGNAENYQVGLFFYASDGTFISYLSWDNTPRTFTTPSNCAFVRFSYQNVSNTFPTKNQLCKGATLDNYDQTVVTALINLGGTYYGGEVDAVTGKITLTHSHITNLGSNIKSCNKENNLWRVEYNSAITQTGNTYEEGICNMLAFKTSYANINTNNNSVGINSSIGLLFRNDDITTAQEATDFLATLDIVYPLATPIVVYASNTAEIPTINGFNQVFADTGNIAVKYLESIKSYIDNKLA